MVSGPQENLCRCEVQNSRATTIVCHLILDLLVTVAHGCKPPAWSRLPPDFFTEHSATSSQSLDTGQSKTVLHERFSTSGMQRIFPSWPDPATVCGELTTCAYTAVHLCGQAQASYSIDAYVHGPHVQKSTKQNCVLYLQAS